MFADQNTFASKVKYHKAFGTSKYAAGTELDPHSRRKHCGFMMRATSMFIVLLVVLASATAAGATIPDFWKLGYRPVDPALPGSPLERTIDQSKRYLVRVTGYFHVRRNPAEERVRIYLPLPADDVYQRVYVSRLRPAPAEILHSRHGYQIAAFDFGVLPRGAEIVVRYDAEVAVGKIQWTVDPSQVGPLTDIPAAIREDYLVDGEFYRVNDPAVRAAAHKAVGDERHPLRMMARILSHVRKSLTYVLDGRKVDAATTLKLGHGSCTEHTFLMIGMARSLGLPARFMAGSVRKVSPFTRHHYDRVYHKIVEVYLPRIGWVPVETTAARHRAMFAPEKLVGASNHQMLFFVHEPEPGLAPLDPRRNIITHRPFGVESQLSLGRQVTVHWERLW